MPIMIQAAITNAVGLVDNMMVGTLGTESITAVSIAIQIIFIYYLAVFGGHAGPGIYTAQYHGQGNTEGIRQTFRIKCWISLFCLITGIFIFYFFGREIILLYMQGDSNNIDVEFTLNTSKEYLNIMLIGLLPFSVTHIYATTLRETGDSIKPMVAGLSSVVTDIILNYILIFGNFGFPALGVRGAAIATVISRFVELFVIVIWSHSRTNQHKFLSGIYTTLLIPLKILPQILIRTIPIFINEVIWAAGIAVLTQCYSLLGLEIVAGLNISNTLCNLFNIVFVYLGEGIGIITGQLLGAGEFEYAKKAAWKLILFGLAVTLVPTLLLIGIAIPFPKIYDTTAKIQSLTTVFIFISAAFFPVQSLIHSMYFILRSGGKTLITFLFDGVFNWCITIPVAALLCTKSSLSIIPIFLIIQSLDFIKITFGFILLKKGIWITNLTSDN